jgi:hypothetical protein
MKTAVTVINTVQVSPAFIVIAAIVCFAIFIMSLYGIMLNLTKN